MDEYQTLVRNVLLDGSYKPNRTAVDTVSTFGQFYEIDVGAGFPLLTTKQMTGFRWRSLIHELLWYFSGEEHVRTLREHTKIWDAWSDGDGHLETAYGRFWRRYPIPNYERTLEGESWIHTAGNNRWDDSETIDTDRWITTESSRGSETESVATFDQLQYVIDMLNENPQSRRLVVNAWHPGNATVSKLPPCHYSFVFNVQGDRLNLHLTQRSGDTALGIPFNIAAYSLILTIVAQQTGFKPGTFAHSIVDAHIYCGGGDRGAWYADNLSDVQRRISACVATGDREGYREIADWIEHTAPAEAADQEHADHIPGLLRQLGRTPLDRPTLHVADKPLDDLQYDDIRLENYESHDGISFGVAE